MTPPASLLYWRYDEDLNEHSERRCAHGWHDPRARAWWRFGTRREIDLPEGKEVTITIFDRSAGHDPDAFLRSRGGWKGLVDAEELIRNIRESRRASTRPEPRL